MKNLIILITLLIVVACGKRTKHVTNTEYHTEFVEVIKEVPVETSPVICQVFTTWNKTTLPTAHQVKGNLEIELDSMSLGVESNSSMPFQAFLNTDAFDVVSNFALRCSLSFEVKTNGNHVFSLESDDGSELYLNGTRIINNGGAHAMQLKTKTVNLTQGVHELRVHYYQGSGVKGLNLTVQEPAIVQVSNTL